MGQSALLPYQTTINVTILGRHASVEAPVNESEGVMVVLRRTALAGLSVLTALSHTASAKEPWPHQAVRVIVPFSPGRHRSWHGFCRAPVAALGQAGRGRESPRQRWHRWRSNAFKAANDRHTLLFSFAGPITINPLLHARLPYDPDQDLIAHRVARSLEVDSIGAFVALAGRHPGKYNWAATPGLPHYIFLALQKRTGIELTEVPYKDSSPMVQDLGEQRVHVVVTVPSLLLPPVQAG
jgi:tripartite-type tricarboxylate transporter receptor subunit TctC